MMKRTKPGAFGDEIPILPLIPFVVSGQNGHFTQSLSIRPHPETEKTTSHSACIFQSNCLQAESSQADRILPQKKKEQLEMSSTSKTWVVAASIGAVEALKDQLGVCRWNYALRSAQQHLRNKTRSVSQAKSLSSSSSSSYSAATVSSKIRDDKARQAEESLRTVMYLSCWGPN
ncbi:PREDICTED: uncharacterized protein LOC104815653 [Tarenaya hassleriana]|uniref:uncharacterized protein LOC104815653 n=1 Tax=Tarenaya hassleriana TaxID=28532 RepID=UPI00053C5B0B|nr:PREDICTED: uncharacterized protein LOC104815653 [Tarenaya hassleriana]